jgi:hypothetical protein
MPRGLLVLAAALSLLAVSWSTMAWRRASSAGGDFGRRRAAAG